MTHTAFNKKNTFISGASVIALLLATPAIAQDSDDKRDRALEEIVVTAQKRAQSLQDVPISLTAFTNAFLENAAAESLNDITQYTPGLEGGGVTQATFEMRGVKTSDFGVGTESAVGVYIDGVYAARSGAAVTAFSDVERIEVLKGPQGTLFGRNTAAGAIAIHTNKPSTDAVDGFLKLRYGRWNKRRVEGMLNVPLSDVLAFRANLVVNKRDGYVKDGITGEDYGREDNDTGRFQLRWEPSAETSVNLAFEFDSTNQDEQTPVLGVGSGILRSAPDANTLGQVPGQGDVLQAILGMPADTPLETLYAAVPISAFYANFVPAGYMPDPNADWDFFRDARSFSGADPFGTPANDTGNGHETRSLWGANLTIQHSMDWADFTSITSYKTFNTTNLEDEDATQFRHHYLDTENIEDNEAFSQEFRLNGQEDNFTWTVGGSYFWERAEQVSAVRLYSDSIDTALYNMGIVPGLLAQSFNPLDGLNGCETRLLDSFSGFVSFNNTPLECFDPGLGALLTGAGFPGASLESLANLTGGSMSDAVWQEDMWGQGRNKAWALYGDVTFAASDKFNLTAGLRYTEDTKQWSWLNTPRVVTSPYIVDIPGLGNLFDIQQQIFAGITGALVRPDSRGDLVYDVGNSEGVMVTNKKKWTNFSPRFVIDYKVSDDVMVYGSYTLGYKAGGFNSQGVPGINPATGAILDDNESVFDNEKVWNVEFGMKSEFMDNRLRLNVATWQYRYDNQQSIFLSQPSVTDIPKYVLRVQDVKGRGVDAGLTWLVDSNFTTYANVGYQDITCAENCSGVQRGVTIDTTGEPTGVPSWKMNIGGAYTADLSGGNSLTFSLDHSYTSANRENKICRANRTCGVARVGDVTWDTSNARNNTNVRVTYNDAEDRFYVSAFAKNLFNNQYPSGAGGLAFDILGSADSSVPKPWYWGLDVGLNF